MKSALVVTFLAVSAFAQAQSAGLPAACGPRKITFDVTLSDSQQTLAQLEPGRARVYFIQDNGSWSDYQHFTLKIGLDGAWVGAYIENSYFALSVEPGEHHVCANVQSNSSVGHLLALAHFTAEPGKAYYFRTRFLDGPSWRSPYVDLDPVDSDQAKYMIDSFPLSLSHPRP